FGRLLRKVGAIGIDRTPKKEGEPRQSMVEAMAELFKQQDKLCIVVTPEGTRSKQEKWRTGFYHVAKMANVPIALGYMDYAKKEAGIQVVVYPTDDMHADMKKIMEFYQTINGKFPEKFSIDKQYLQAPQEKN
ncbi:MAG: 1-acyl-sn-glycerol-3-phosphate acyltransferase, partial [Bernardetiaceae bacterium]|nr:1-acyl-sn-glycerol-3-phosphate acyltransferase [Bernardetiaceae bacterium]